MIIRIEQDSRNSLTIRDDNDNYVCEIIAQDEDTLSSKDWDNANKLKASLELTKTKKLMEVIDGKLDVIDGDERFHYADHTVNTPHNLALVQMEMKVKVFVFEEMRELISNESPGVFSLREKLKFGPE